MSDTRRRLGSLALTVGLLAANLAAFNWLIAGMTRARLDLTEDRRFSISPVTEQILDTLDENLTVIGYFSDRTHPKLAPLVPQITDMLAEYRALSGGRVQVEILDPGDDEAIEQEAADRYGVRSTPFRLASKYEAGIVNAYFALVIRYGDRYERYEFQDLVEVEPMPDGDIDVRLRNLEYDLTRAIKKVVYGFQSSTELFERVQDPVRFTAIMTPASLPEIFAGVPDAVRTAAEALEEAGGDAFEYEELDPSGDPELAARMRSQWGLAPMGTGLFGGDDSFWLYGIVDVGGNQEQLVLTGEDISAADVREAIESSIKRYTPGFLKTVGVVAPQPDRIPPQVRMQMNLPPEEPPEYDEVQRFLEQDYAVRDVTLGSGDGVPPEVDVLLVLQPKELSDEAVYDLDQYLMRGGRIVLCSGAFDSQFSGEGLRVTPVDSGLGDWLAHLGVTIEPTLVLDDRNQALPLPEVRYTPLGAMRTWRMEPYPYLVQVRDDGFVDRNVTASLDSVGIYWGSPLQVDDDAVAEGVEVLPILRSSAESWTDDDLSRVSFVDYTVPEEGTEPHLLAVALSGRFDSYYADHPVPPPPMEVDDEGNETPAGPAAVPLERSPETRLVVVGNAEFLSDFVARSLGQTDSGFFVENLRFAQNVIDWTTLDNDMIGIRSRGGAVRRLVDLEPSTRVGIEAVNYVLPVGLVVALAAWVAVRRRRTVPLVTPASGREDAR